MIETLPRRRRSYQMTARATAAAKTASRLLDVAVELFTDNPYDEVSLDRIAARAGVTKRTLLRRFGSKEAIFVAATMNAAERVMKRRDTAPVGDIAGAVANVVESYEDWGPNRLRMLAQEDRNPIVRENVEGGRQYHWAWVEKTFAPLLKGLRGASRDRRVAALVAITDVYTWKLLRRDLRLSQAETEKVLVELITSMKGGN
jgi:AcrR family transcriptional regulator